MAKNDQKSPKMTKIAKNDHKITIRTDSRRISWNNTSRSCQIKVSNMFSMKQIAEIMKNRRKSPKMTKIAKKWPKMAKKNQKRHFQIKWDICENLPYFCQNLSFS